LRQQYYERTWDAPSPAALNAAPNALWREFELARPHILGALLDAAAHGLHMLPQVRLQRLSRMADFALWATACESAFRPAGTLETAYSNNRRGAIPQHRLRRPWRPWRNLTAPTSECLSCRAASGGLTRALTKHPFLS